MGNSCSNYSDLLDESYYGVYKNGNVKYNYINENKYIELKEKYKQLLSKINKEQLEILDNCLKAKCGNFGNSFTLPSDSIKNTYKTFLDLKSEAEKEIKNKNVRGRGSGKSKNKSKRKSKNKSKRKSKNKSKRKSKK